MAGMIEVARATVTIVPNMAGAQEEITRGLADASKGAESAGSAAGHSFGGALTGAIGKGLRTVSGAVVGALTASVDAAVDFGRASVEAGMSFDASMSQVAATMGTTVDQIGDLRDFALEMGSSTAFSASQAADALNYMALAGYDAETSMAMLPNVLNLAAAGGIELATASDMITDASSALGLNLEQTSYMVDQMARASSISNTSVAQLGDALLTLGATGANAADGTVELTTVLGVLADNGIKGSEAGTHLRNMILSLTNPTTEAAGLLEELGISVYDSEGSMRNMVDIIGDLQEATSSLTQEQSDSVISTLFNRADLASVNALLNTSTERFDELTNSIYYADGAAEAMADTQLDNLAGDITIFQSALEGAQIALSDQLTPTLREFVSFGTEGLSSITAAFNEGGISGAMSALGGWLSDGLTMILGMVPEFISTAREFISAFGQGLIDNADLITEALQELLPFVIEFGGMLISSISTFLPQLTPVITSGISLISQTIIQNLPVIIQSGLQLVVALATGLASNFSELIPVVVESIGLISNTLLENLDQVISAAIEITLAVISGLTEALPELSAMVPEIIITISGTLLDNLDVIIAAAFEILGALGTGLINALPDLLLMIPTIVDGILGEFARLGVDLASSALEWGADMISNLVDGIRGAIGDVADAVGSVASTVASYLHFSEPDVGPLSNFHTYAPDMIDLFTEGLEDGERQIQGTFEEVLRLPDPNTSADILTDSSLYVDGSGADTSVTIPVYIGQDKIDTVVVKSLKTNTYRRGG